MMLECNSCGKLYGCDTTDKSPIRICVVDCVAVKCVYYRLYNEKKHLLVIDDRNTCPSCLAKTERLKKLMG